MAASRTKQLELAQKLADAGQIEQAITAYKQLGAVDEAARLLSVARRFEEGARLLAGTLGVAPAQVGQLDGPMKKRALMAAILFARAGDPPRAVELFLGLGERERAAETLEKAGDSVAADRIRSGELLPAPSLLARRAVGGQAESLAAASKLEQEGKLELALDSYLRLQRLADAARIARALGRTADAAQLYAEGGIPYEAARCYYDVGDTGKSLDNLLRVPRDDPRYRHAAQLAIQLAAHLKVTSLQLELFLGAFVRSGPQSAAEEDSFYALGALYAARDDGANAQEAFDKLCQRNPDYKDAARRLAGLGHEVPTRSLELGELPELAIPQATVLARPAGRRPTLATLAPQASPAPFAVGERIAERYRLEAKIGQGGMAAVFRAHDEEIDERVALKVFDLPEANAVAVARFKQELKLSRQLSHPNIIRLHDLGIFRGHRYISMELLLGESLKTRLKNGMSFPDALGLLEQACAGLGAAHAQGVVHRDVKPDNLFVTLEGVLKVMDFGIARQVALPGVTMAGTIAGTPAYMSPEQINGFSGVTHSTDLYALGIVAYEMFTGTLPFAHEELTPLLVMQTTQVPQPPCERNPEIPASLNALILKLLEKNPAHRYSSCAELAAAVRTVREQAFWSAP